MRIVITGGTGLIGSQLVDRLLAEQAKVVILTRSPQKYQNRASVTYAKWDAKTAEGWAHHVDGADAVINLAGESIAGESFPPPRWTPERKARILNSRLGAGEAVTQAIAAATQKPKVLLQASAVGFYGNCGSEAVTEQSSSGNDFLAGVVKQWEASTATVEAMGVRRVMMRIGVVYSTEGGALPVTLLPFRLFAGGPLGSGKQYVPWIHVDDLVSAMLFLLRQETAVGPYNLTAPNPMTNGEMAKVIGKVMRRPAFIPAPAFAIKLLLGEAAMIALDGQKALPVKLQAAGFDFRYETAVSALQDLLG